MSERLEPLASEQEELLSQLRPAWQNTNRLESPPPQALARARTLYRQAAALAIPRARAHQRLLPSRRIPFYAFSVITLAVLLVLFIGTWGTVIGRAQDALPGQALYPVKTQTEQVRLVTTIDKASKAELCMTLAQTRVREVEALAANGDLGQIPDTLATFDELVQQASDYIKVAAASNPERVAVLAPDLEAILQKSEYTLTGIAPRAPSTEGAIARALATSRRGKQAIGAALLTALKKTPTPAGGAAAPGGDQGTRVPSGGTPLPTAYAEPTPGPAEPDNTPQPTNTHRPDNTPRPTNTHNSPNTPQPSNTRKPGGDPNSRPTKTPRP